MCACVKWLLLLGETNVWTGFVSRCADYWSRRRGKKHGLARNRTNISSYYSFVSVFNSARETNWKKKRRHLFSCTTLPVPPNLPPLLLLLLPISALVSPPSCSLLGTWHKKRIKHKKKSWKLKNKKNIIKSSADPWNLYVILHFFWLYLKEKKNEVIGHFSRKLIVFAPPSCVCAIFTDFFF